LPTRILCLIFSLFLGLYLLTGCESERKPFHQKAAKAKEASSAKGKRRYVTIGTGVVSGVYHPTGGAIAKIVNNKSKLYNIRFSVESTAGSVENINAIMAGEMEFGVVQSDRQYQAINGLAEWSATGPQRALRSVFTVHSETHVLTASENSGIMKVEDLAGKAVGVGNPGSGQRQNFIDILAEYGMSHKDLGRAEGLKVGEASKMLQDGRIDAFVYTVGHPADIFKEATSGRIKVRFVPFKPAKIKSLIHKYPYYVQAGIPVSYYPGVLNTADVPTFAVKATVVTRADVDEDLVYAVTKEVFENFSSFKNMHPAYKTLTPKNMLKGMSAPIHPGAMRYYKEAGLQ
jgi:TRAP transporter TAXI family solute receptor